MSDCGVGQLGRVASKCVLDDELAGLEASLLERLLQIRRVELDVTSRVTSSGKDRGDLPRAFSDNAL